jgi:CxxC-x17-CxxC domain-containing protein
MEFVDRLLTCADCGGEFIFTAGEQIFFFDKQFKNDPKRCKPCKSKRSGAAVRAAAGGGPLPAGLSRTETRTECSECGIETTVPFKPTQGRPVLCRQCFQNKRPVAAEAGISAASTVEMIAGGGAGDHGAAVTELAGAATPASHA